MKFLLPLFIAFSLLSGCQPSSDDGDPFVFHSHCEEAQGEFEPLTFTAEPDLKQAQVNGVICSGSYDAFKAMLTAYPQIKLLRIQSIPGSADDDTNLALSETIHKMGLSTYLGSQGVVESGGTDFFLAGVMRKAEKGAKLGVHTWASENDQGETIAGVDLPKDTPEHQYYIDYYKNIGLSKPEEFYWFTMNAAPTDGIYYMSAQELDYFGFNTANFSF